MKLTILVGLPRAGKSTWCTQNTNKAVLVSNDWIRENILGTHYCNAANAIVWSIVDSTLRIVLGQGKDAILDGINHTKAVRSFYIKLAKEYNAEVELVVFDTPLSVCRQRNTTLKLPNDRIDDISKAYEIPSINEGVQKITIVTYTGDT